MRDVCLTAKVRCGGFVRRLALASLCRSLNDRARSRLGALDSALARCARACANPYSTARAKQYDGWQRLKVCACSSLRQAVRTTSVWSLRTCRSVKRVVLDTAFFPRPRLLVRVACVCCVCMAALLYGITLHPSTGGSFVCISSWRSCFSHWQGL